MFSTKVVRIVLYGISSFCFWYNLKNDYLFSRKLLRIGVIINIIILVFEFIISSYQGEKLIYEIFQYMIALTCDIYYVYVFTMYINKLEFSIAITHVP